MTRDEARVTGIPGDDTVAQLHRGANYDAQGPIYQRSGEPVHRWFASSKATNRRPRAGQVRGVSW